MEQALEVPEEKTQSLTVSQVHQQVQLIQQVMRSEMRDGEHFGTIPGCGPKPALLKAGSEKLCLTFRLAPRHKCTEKDLGNGHLEVVTVTELFHIDSHKFLGEGVGSCSTLESKYRYREQGRKCPACGAEAIIKGKTEYGGGWLCYGKKGGCGEKYKDGDAVIEGQAVGRIENPDIADTYNTVRKMSKKRSLIDAVLTATAASDIFTQDIDEFPDMAGIGPTASKPVAKPAPLQEPRRAVSSFEPSPQEAQEAEYVDPATGEVLSEPVEDNTDPVDEPPPPPRAAAKPAPRAGIPKDAKHMKSQFSGSLCPACKKPIAKGAPIVKGTIGWVHDPDCYR